jgi:hypothetical protein
MNLRTFSISITPDQHFSHLLLRLDEEMKKSGIDDTQLVDVTIEGASTPNSNGYMVANVYYNGKDSDFSMLYEEFISESDNSVEAMTNNLRNLSNWVCQNGNIDIHDLKSTITINSSGDETVTTRIFYSKPDDEA